MYKCSICGKEFEEGRALGGHKAIHFRDKEKAKRNHARKWKNFSKNCKKCGKQFEVMRFFREGEYRKQKGEKEHCKQACANSQVHDERWKEKIGEGMKNNIPWNKGVGVKKVPCKSCQKEIFPRKNGLCKKCYDKSGLHSAIMKGKTGGYRPGSGRTEGAYYKNHWFDSQFEIDVVKFLEKHKIQWQRNTKRFHFEWNGEQTYYIPDLYLPEYDMFLETKGYWWEDKKEKTEYVVKLHNLRWTCLMFKQEWLIDRNILLEKLRVAGSSPARRLSLSNH